MCFANLPTIKLEGVGPRNKLKWPKSLMLFVPNPSIFLLQTISVSQFYNLLALHSLVPSLHYKLFFTYSICKQKKAGSGDWEQG